MRLIRFTAEWCGPCKKLKPIMDKIQQEHPDLQVDVVDIDTPDGRMAAAGFNVSGVPTLIKVDHLQNEVARLVGAHPKGKIEKHFEIG